MVSIGLIVNRGYRAFLGPDATGEIAKMIDCQRDIRGHRFTDRLAIVYSFGDCQGFQIGFHAVGNLVENIRAFSGRCLAPGSLGGMRSIKRTLDIFRRGTGNFAKYLTSDRCHVFEIGAIDRGHELTADEIVVTLLEWVLDTEFTNVCEIHVILRLMCC